MIKPSDRLRLIEGKAPKPDIDPVLVGLMKAELLRLIEKMADNAIRNHPARSSWHVDGRPNAHLGGKRWVNYNWVDVDEMLGLLRREFPEWQWSDLKIHDNSAREGWWSTCVTVRVGVKS